MTLSRLCRASAAAIALTIGAGPANAADFHVAVDGNDANPGTKERPLATLEAARDAARKAGPGPHRIVVMPGDYFLSNTLELDARDNGLTIEADPAGKATLFGGRPVTGWRRDGDKFWCADLPGVKEGAWDFRALVVNGRMPERARLPETGAFKHKSEWKGARYISGAWDPKPTQEQRTTVLYDPNDVPATLDIQNAEIRMLHMWNEATYGIAQNDSVRHAFVLSSPTIHPPGAFGVRDYVLFNTREGMTRPDRWYLDRPAGRLVYWPMPGEDMTQAKIVAPRLERLIRIAGTAKQPVERITLRGLVFQATTTQLGARGYVFGANGYEGAISVERSRQCTLEKIEIANVGGEGISLRSRNEAIRILDSHIHHIGACGMEIASTGAGSLVSRNHIDHVGLQYPCAVSMIINSDSLHIYRNEIHDIPYCGIVCSGSDCRIEENLIYRVMQVMHDGAAIYGHLTHTILRGNMVRDVVELGKGFGASAYYLDEQSCDCVVERNVAIGVPMPTHNHISRNLIYRDNVFIADKDMALSFGKSANCAFERNMLFAPGDITINQPNALKTWRDNAVFRSGLGKDGSPQPFTISGAMPPMPVPQRRPPTAVTRAALPPTLDGEIGLQEWPGEDLSLDREPSRWPASGVPVHAELCYDDQCLYLGVSAGLYQISKLRTGTAWGKDDGAEICIAGRTPDAKPATFVIRGFAGGALQSVTDAGAPADASECLGKNVRFVSSKWSHGWRGEWSIPWDALGLKPAPGQKLAFNIGVFRSEDEVWRCYEGTLAENWRLDQAAVLLIR